MTPLYLSENFSTTLNVGGGITNSQTTGIVLTSVSGLNTSGGWLCIDWAANLDTSVAEYIKYTGISGNTLTGVVRGDEGSSGKAHSNGATVVAVVSKNHVNILADKLRGIDTVAIEDANANELLKTSTTVSAVNELTIANAATGAGPTLSATGGDTNIDINLLPKGSGVLKVNGVAVGAVATGTPVQEVYTQTGAVATGTTVTPFDDTIPQNTEGDQYMSLAITPTSATNKLLIEVLAICSSSVAGHMAVALFQDTTANALAVSAEYENAGTTALPIPLRHEMVAGTTSATTFKIRIGNNAAGTTTFNGTGAARIYGGVVASSIRITEFKV